MSTHSVCSKVAILPHFQRLVCVEQEQRGKVCFTEALVGSVEMSAEIIGTGAIFVSNIVG